MYDLNIIRRIEESFHVKLRSTTFRVSKNEYVLDESGNVADLHISGVSTEDLSLISQLSQLERLAFSNCEIPELSSLAGLNQLISLELNSNKLSDLSTLPDLEKLQSLDLSNNKISNIRPLEKLHNLTNLSLGGNFISNIGTLAVLTKLTSLGLSHNRISSLEAVSKLTGLEVLLLHNNMISEIGPLSELKNLRSLSLNDNHIADIGPVSELENLTVLDLTGNQITNIGPIAKLTQLQHLFLNDNYISDVKPLQPLKKLASLYLNNNMLRDLDLSSELTELVDLNLSNNQITNLPRWISNLDVEFKWDESSFVRGVNLYGNPLIVPPVEIFKEGREAVKRYFEHVQKQGLEPIYEVKLILVGEGGAGKTSLQVRLIDPDADLPKQEERTRGIKIIDWPFKKENGNTHTVHIWDFGGQDVYYPVHRFFLTEDAIFVLLATTRQAHHNFDYWIPTIYQFGGPSPIILGQTCHDGNKVSWNDLGLYVGSAHFNIIKTGGPNYVQLNLVNRNEGLAEMKQLITSQITSLKHYGKEVPKSWVQVRRRIAEEKALRACIAFEIFENICREISPKGFVERIDIEDCARFLHKIGVILWYDRFEELSNWVVLDPEWAMGAVYRIIDDNEVQLRKGHISTLDFKRIWSDNSNAGKEVFSYVGKEPLLKRMLEIFKVAFPKSYNQGYILPVRLLSMPAEFRWQHDERHLRLVYQFTFMPRGMINQFTAQLNRYIGNENEVWNNAVNLNTESNTARCQAEEDFYRHQITIKGKGRDARGLMSVAMNALNEIIAGYKGVEPEIIVPCTCKACVMSDRPTSFHYHKLLAYLEKGRDKVTCNEEGEELAIDGLLFQVGLPAPLKIEKEHGELKPKTIRIFLASSAELETDRREFEIFIGRENKDLIRENIFLELNIWEDFIDAMSVTRLQDKYNEVVRASDIFVSLFFTKVGKYTEEEFENAFGQFKKSGKPLIYTYFKNEKIDISKINENDISTKFAFQKKLKQLEHFSTTYESVGDLKYRFKVQLQKILPDLLLP